MSQPQILAKEKDCQVRLDGPKSILSNVAQVESSGGSMENTGSHLKLSDPGPRKKALPLPECRSEMKCERCVIDGAQATYRVFSGIIHMKVCAACADEARKLRINVEPLD